MKNTFNNNTTQIGHEFFLQSSHGSLYLLLHKFTLTQLRCWHKPFKLNVLHRFLEREKEKSCDGPFFHSNFNIQMLSANQFTISLFVFQAALGSARRAPARCSRTVRSTGAEWPPGSVTRWGLRGKMRWEILSIYLNSTVCYLTSSVCLSWEKIPVFHQYLIQTATAAFGAYNFRINGNTIPRSLSFPHFLDRGKIFHSWHFVLTSE